MNRAAFFTHLRRRDSGAFGTSLSQGQVDGINGIFEAFEAVGNGRVSTLAYALATAYHETGHKMMPNRENMTYTTAERIFAVFGPRRITSIEEARRYVRSPQALANKVYNGMLGNRPGTDDGWVYRGGGYPHLTGRGNYRDSSADAGVDLVANPEAMLDPVISGRVLILGLMDGRWNKERRGVEHYEMLDGLPGLSEVEAIAARRTVNVQDKAALIAGYYRAFRAALVAGGMVDATTATAKPVDNSPAPETDDKPRGLLAAILALLARIFGKGNA